MSETNNIQFSGVKVGETFMIGDMEFIRFSEQNGMTPVVMKEISFRSRFGNNNDFRESTVLKKLQEDILPRIIEVVGEENVCEFEIDLTTLDGLKPYEPLKSRISLPTLDFYRANAEIFGKYKPGSWWWLATPDSAEPNDSPYWVLCVSPAGGIYNGGFSHDYYGVRPFLILKSSIFDSCEEQ